MHRSRFIPTALAVAIGLAGCGGASDPAPTFDQTPEGGTAAKVAPVFNFISGEFPIPNDILFSLQASKAAAGTADSELPASEQEGVDGTMFASYDPTNPVLVGIDHMDGASTLAHIDVKFDGSLDPDQPLDANPFVVSSSTGALPNPAQNVFLLPLRYAGGDAVSNSGEIPTLVPAYDFGQALGLLGLAQEVQAIQEAIATADPARGPTAEEQAKIDLFTALGGLAAVGATVAEWSAVASSPEARAEVVSLDGGVNNAIRITPLKPLQPRTKYLVVFGKNITTAEGEPIGESAFYELMSDTTQAQTGSLAPVQAAVAGWEELANGWFGFVEAAYQGAIEFDPGIAFSYTFTTTDPQSVLKSIAAPAQFFTENAIVDAKQSAISNLLDGTFNALGASPDFFAPLGGVANCAAPAPELVDGCTSAAVATAINTQLLAQLVDPTWEFYSPVLAQTYGAAAQAAAAAESTTYAGVLAAAAANTALASNASSLAHYMQLSAAEAAENAPVPNGGGATFAQFIASEAATTAGGLGPAGLNVLPQPQNRASSFTAAGCLGNAAAGCADANFLQNGDVAPLGNSILYTGQLEDLPYYLKAPNGADPSPILTGFWEADEALFQTLGSTLPSTKVTYRVPFPAKQADVTVPVVAVVPNEGFINAASGGLLSKPADGWPVIIYQHGITANRTNALPLGHALANACLSGGDCFATIAIDQPLHGVAPDTTNIAAVGVGTFGVNDELQERHFYWTATGNPDAPVGQMTADSGTSGSLFQNFTSFPTGRDNLRQASVDLMNLLASIGSMDVDGLDNGPDFDTDRVYFMGHSLGAVDGIPFLAVNDMTADATGQPKVKAAAILNSGGFVTQLLMNSPSPDFGAPRILASLGAAGISQGSSSLETFLNVLQGMLDSADSMNFAESLGAGSMSLLFTEIRGGDSVNTYDGVRFVSPLPEGGAICTEQDTIQDGCVTEVVPSDQTIPNAADAAVWGADLAELDNSYAGAGSGKNAGDAWVINGQAVSVTPVSGTPLAGTEPMLTLAGATQARETDADSGKWVGVTRFTRGSHSNPVSAGVTVSTDADGSPVVGDKFSSSRVFNQMAAQIGTLFTSHALGAPDAVNPAAFDGCVIEASANNDRSACPDGPQDPL